MAHHDPGAGPYPGRRMRPRLATAAPPTARLRRRYRRAERSAHRARPASPATSVSMPSATRGSTRTGEARDHVRLLPRARPPGATSTQTAAARLSRPESRGLHAAISISDSSPPQQPSEPIFVFNPAAAESALLWDPAGADGLTRPHPPLLLDEFADSCPIDLPVRGAETGMTGLPRPGVPAPAR